MMKTLCLAWVCFAMVASVRAQSMGTMTAGGAVMDVKATVLGWDAGKADLHFYLLPFEPTAEEISKLQAEDWYFLKLKPNPDPKKWATCPWGELRVIFNQDSIGNLKKALWAQVSWLNMDKSDTDVTLEREKGFEGTITGTLKVGQEIVVTTKGSDASRKVAWDLVLKGKVLASTKK
jgi:hypothetical protein